MYVLQIRLPAVPKQRRKMTRFDVSICWSRWPLHEAKQKNPGQLSLIKPFVILFSEVNFWWPFSVGEWRRCRISTSSAISHCCSLYTVTRRWSAGWSYEASTYHNLFSVLWSSWRISHQTCRDLHRNLHPCPPNGHQDCVQSNLDTDAELSLSSFARQLS